MLGSRIKSERKRLGLTQQELADKLHIARSNVSNWEANSNGISTDFLSMLADFFGCTTDYLLGKTEFRNEFPINQTEISNLEEISKHLTEDQKMELGFYNLDEKATGASALFQGLYDMGLLKGNEPISDKQVEVILEFISNNKKMIQFLMDGDKDD